MDTNQTIDLVSSSTSSSSSSPSSSSSSDSSSETDGPHNLTKLNSSSSIPNKEIMQSKFLIQKSAKAKGNVVLMPQIRMKSPTVSIQKAPPLTPPTQYPKKVLTDSKKVDSSSFISSSSDDSSDDNFQRHLQLAIDASAKELSVEERELQEVLALSRQDLSPEDLEYQQVLVLSKQDLSQQPLSPKELEYQQVLEISKKETSFDQILNLISDEEEEEKEVVNNIKPKPMTRSATFISTKKTSATMEIEPNFNSLMPLIPTPPTSTTTSTASHIQKTKGDEDNQIEEENFPQPLPFVKVKKLDKIIHHPDSFLPTKSGTFYHQFASSYPKTIPPNVNSIPSFIIQCRDNQRRVIEHEVNYSLTHNNIPVSLFSFGSFPTCVPIRLSSSTCVFTTHDKQVLPFEESVIPYVPSLPKQNAWVPIQSLVTSPDDGLLRYVPHFGDSDSDDALADVYDVDDVSTQGKNRNKELQAQLYEQDDIILEQYMIQNLHVPFSELPFELLESALVSKDVPTSGGARGGKDEFEEDCNEDFKSRLARILKSYKISQGMKTTSSLIAPDAPLESSLMDSFRSLFCRVCFLYDCGNHDQKSTIGEYAETAWEVQKKWRNEKQSVIPDQPCGESCYLLANRTCSLNSLTFREQMLCAKMIVILHSHSICEVAHLLNFPTCTQVYEIGRKYIVSNENSSCLPEETYLAAKRETDGVSCHLENTTKAICSKLMNKSFSTQFTKTQSCSETARKLTKDIKDGILPETSHNPCHHFGPCHSSNPSCTCVSATSFCTKHCSCAVYGCATTTTSTKGDVICKNLFPGCRCASGQCRTKACPCFSLHVECDLDICHPNVDCRNCEPMVQHLLVAESTIPGAGWGVFYQKFIPKDEFVSEYLGELVSQEEAERRGRYCDKLNRSYLFNMNTMQVTDAFRKGNKIRFANHSKKPNCYVKIYTVNRQKHVYVFAKRDIQEGEELFFDYHWETNESFTQNAPASNSWYKKRPTPLSNKNLKNSTEPTKKKKKTSDSSSKKRNLDSKEKLSKKEKCNFAKL